MPHALPQGARKRRRRGSALRITRATKLPLRRQVRGRLGWCSKSHYPRIIVFNSFSRRIISQGLVRPPICSFFFSFLAESSDSSDLSISRFSSWSGKIFSVHEEATANYENVGNHRISRYNPPWRSMLDLCFNCLSVKSNKKEKRFYNYYFQCCFLNKCFFTFCLQFFVFINNYPIYRKIFAEIYIYIYIKIYCINITFLKIQYINIIHKINIKLTYKIN